MRTTSLLTLCMGFASALIKPAKTGGSVHVPLETFFNNKGFGSFPGEASLNSLGESYPANSIGTNGVYTSSSTGVTYRFPGYNADRRAQDNVICEGQTIHISPSDDYFSVNLLLVSDVQSTTVSGNLTLLYDDHTMTTSEVRAHAFWWFLAARRGEITFPYFFTHNSTNGNASDIYERYATVENGKKLKAIVLPETTNATTGRLHLFSLSLWKAGDAQVEIQAVRPTQNLDENGNQIVEVIANHVGSQCVSGLSLSVQADGVSTVKSGLVKRLCPGDQKRVPVSIKGSSNGPSTVMLDIPGFKRTQASFNDVLFGIRKWTTDATSLVNHEPPIWYDGAKFGIFIHYGPFSVPSWGNSTPFESYAEWFWWYSTRIGVSAPADRSGFNAYRLRTYGPNLNYDDFFTNYTAAEFDPKAWVDLFADAGAQYFVLTTKHHDGFANFDTEDTTHRSAIHYGPRRDILRDLFDAAEKYQPHLKRGTYFSLPEWFNPDYGKYGVAETGKITSTSWPGIIARNPYTLKNEPYTGRLPIGDYIKDLMVPQMKILAYKYKTDIMWCDAGSYNGTDGFAADWFNWARGQGRQVTINDRCGSPWSADFDTPEYQTFSVAQQRKWESNQGMDPFSYGFNRATKDSEYMNATTLVRNLVDMVSKNGNLLLNIGPHADGTINTAMMSNLREAGTWIHPHGEAIFNTTYWYVTPQEGSLRFTQTNDAFYVFSLEEPVVGHLKIESKLPVQKRDQVTALGLEGEDAVEWGIDEDGKFWINVTEDIVKRDKFCWVFKIKYSSHCSRK